MSTVPRSWLPVLVLTLGLGACASPYTPSPDRPFEAIPEFTASGSVALVNAQPATDEHRVGSFIANLNEWTEVALQITERELTNRGLTAADGAARTLELSVTDALFETGWVKIRSTITLTARTGDGYEASYQGINSSAMMAVPKRQLDGAMMRAVVELLKDPQIVAYLGGTPSSP